MNVFVDRRLIEQPVSRLIIKTYAAIRLITKIHICFSFNITGTQILEGQCLDWCTKEETGRNWNGGTKLFFMQNSTSLVLLGQECFTVVQTNLFLISGRSFLQDQPTSILSQDGDQRTRASSPLRTHLFLLLLWTDPDQVDQWLSERNDSAVLSLDSMPTEQFHVSSVNWNFKQFAHLEKFQILNIH